MKAPSPVPEKQTLVLHEEEKKAGHRGQTVL